MGKRESRLQLTPLSRWLLEELDRRNITARQASLEAGLDHAAIHRYLTGTRPSPASCAKLAGYFDVPEEFVLHLAGHLKLPPGEDVILKQIGQVIADWSEDEKRRVLAMVRALDQERQQPR